MFIYTCECCLLITFSNSLALFDTLIVFLKDFIFSKKLILKKIGTADDKKHAKLLSRRCIITGFIHVREMSGKFKFF